jgi:hypothetical protein
MKVWFVRAGCVLYNDIVRRYWNNQNQDDKTRERDKAMSPAFR